MHGGITVAFKWNVGVENHFNSDKDQELSETKAKPWNKQNNGIAIPPGCFLPPEAVKHNSTPCTQVNTRKPMGPPVGWDETGAVPRTMNVGTEKSVLSVFAHGSLYVGAFHQRNTLP